MPDYNYYRGYVITATSNNNVISYPDGLLIVADDKIDYVGDFNNPNLVLADKEIIEFKNSLILPGLIDAHAHLPQFDAIGLGSNELIDWLNQTIFPLEAKCKNEEYAKATSDKFFQALLEAGTTCASVYTAPFYSAAKIAFESANEKGIRALIGKSAMDIETPTELISDYDTIVKNNLRLIEEFSNFNDKLDYILTPRFAGSCSFKLLKWFGDISKSNNLLVQTHLSENLKEIDFIKELFKDFYDYLEVYEMAGLLSERTIFAHGIYLSESEIDRIKTNGAKIAHCPSSNRYLKSGIARVRKYLNDGIGLGLGTDIGAGYSFSIFDEMREALENSKYRALFYEESDSSLSVDEAFIAGTLGGAQILGLDNNIGSLELCKQADFIVVNFDERYINLSSLKYNEALLKAIYCSQFRNIQNTFIAGERMV